MELAEAIKKIDSLKKEIYSLPPLSNETNDKLMRKFRLEWNYNSNHLEGNTLTYGQTELLLIFEKTTGDHDMREYEEMTAHDVAIKMIYELAHDKERPLTETFIKLLNKTILVRPFRKEAETPDGKPTSRLIKIGDYKEFPNHVKLSSGKMFYYAKPEETPAKMGDFIENYKKDEANKTLHPLFLAAKMHYEFVRIHPFDDGNGRIARLLMNYILIKNDLPPVIIKSKHKRDYLTALNKADTGDVKSFVEYIAEQLIWSLNLTISAAKGKSIEEEDDFEKEIELLSREVKPTEKVQVKKTREILQKIYQSSLKKLLSEMNQKLSAIDKLFFETEHTYTIQGNIIAMQVNIPQTSLDYLDNQFFFDYDQPQKYGYIGGVTYSNNRPNKPLTYPEINKIEIQHRWGGYNAGVNAFNVYYTIEITFDDFKYTITGNDQQNVLLKKLYSEEISDDEIKNATKKLSADVLERIKRSIESVKNN